MDKPSFSHTSSANPHALAVAQLRHAELAFWAKHLPELDDDFELAAQRMYAITGTSEGKIKEIFLALYRLEELPLLKAFQDELGVLDLDKLIAINKSLDKLGTPLPGVLERIDEALTTYLQPRSPNQAPPTRACIKRKLAELINTEDNTISLDNPKRSPRYEVEPLGSQTSRILLTATPDPKIVLHVYRALDIPTAPSFIQSCGWVTGDIPPSANQRELDPTKEVSSYVTPEGIAAFVEGCDGTCRYPGCNRPAEFCQKEHRINHADGGPTAQHNLASLCQHHHDIKTDGQVFYVMDPHTRDIVWLFEDGTWTVTEPTGPLAPKNKRWVQTMGQAIEARRRAAGSIGVTSPA